MAGRFYKLVEQFRDRPFLIGLDPHGPSLPECLRKKGDRRRNLADVVRSFNHAIVDTTLDLCAGYKLNLAHYLAIGATSSRVLLETLRYIRQKAPGLIVILDGKFGDIARTNQRYAEAFLDVSAFDALTVSPYVGGIDSLRPFLTCADQGIFIVCRSSDLSDGNLQTQCIFHPQKKAEALLAQHGLRWTSFYTTAISEGYLLPVYRWVALQTSLEWNSLGNCGLVMAAQHPGDARAVRAIVGEDIPFLVPGIGAQGGNIAAAVKASRNSAGGGVLLASSSHIIYAGSGSDFAEQARERARSLAESISTV